MTASGERASHDATTQQRPPSALPPSASAQPLFVPTQNDDPSVFFYESSDGRWIPRGIALDTEPGVVAPLAGRERRERDAEGVTSVPRFIPRWNPQNIWVTPGGGGAANNWARGHRLGTEGIADILDMLDREAEAADTLDGFLLMQSSAGGSGSGVGSAVLTAARDAFPRATIVTHTVLPSPSDIVVQSYNSIFTLRSLIEEADLSIVVDNSAIGGGGESVGDARGAANLQCAAALAGATASLRFPSHTHTSLSSLATSLSAGPRAHFVIPAISPTTVGEPDEDTTGEHAPSTATRRRTVADHLRLLLQPRASLATLPPKGVQYVSLLLSLRGSASEREVSTALGRVRERGGLAFVPWSPAGVQVAHTPQPCQLAPDAPVSATALQATPALAHSLSLLLRDFDKLRRRAAFVTQYTLEPGFGDRGEGADGEREVDGEAEFDDARDAVQSLVDEYGAMGGKDYLEWLQLMQ